VSPLLDLRFVRNLAGDWSRCLLESSLGSSDAAPPLTLMPMLSFAVVTVADALDRQLPPSHFRLAFFWRVWPSEPADVVEAVKGDSDSDTGWLAGALSGAVLVSGPLEAGVVDGPGLSGGCSGASGFGLCLDFLRGLMLV